MPEFVERGATVTVEAEVVDISGTLQDATAITVSIVDARGDTVISGATPTRVSLGRYTYDYPVDGEARLGAWAAHWEGSIAGFPIDDEDGFTVVPAGALSLPGGTGLTIAHIMDQCLNEVLIGTFRAHFNTLHIDIDDVVTSVVMEFPIQGLAENAYIEIDQEIMYVVPGGMNETARTFSVIRGMKGTIPAAHSEGAGVSINPRFPRYAIFGAMVEEIRSWPNEIFRVVQGECALSGVDWIDLSTVFDETQIIRPLKVWRTKISDSRLVRLSGWRFERDALGPGTAALYLAEPPSTAITVQLAVRFTDVIDGENVSLADLDMGNNFGDLLKYGAAWRLVTGRETRRLFTEVEAEGRVAADVPVTANLTLGRQLKTFRDIRLGEEIQRLRGLYGVSRV